MSIDIRYVIKASATTLIAAVPVSILTWIPLFDGIFVLFFCLGAFLIPIGAGLLYDYFTPEHEELGERSSGGLLAGGIAGLMFGLLLGLETFVSQIVAGSSVGHFTGRSGITLIFSMCGFVVSSLAFGAIGGIICPVLQRNRVLYF